MSELPVWFDGMLRAAQQGHMVHDPTNPLLLLGCIVGYLLVAGLVYRLIQVTIHDPDGMDSVGAVFWPLTTLVFVVYCLCTAGPRLVNAVIAWRARNRVPAARVVQR